MTKIRFLSLLAPLLVIGCARPEIDAFSSEATSTTKEGEMTLFYVASSSWQGNVLSLTGISLQDENLFEVAVKKLEPTDPLPLQELVSDEGNFAVFAGGYLWRVDVSLEPAHSAVNRPQPPHHIPNHEFPYHEYGLPPVVYAHITGALVAWL